MAAPRTAWLARARRRASAAARVARRIIGVPDYERYVAHLRERHPGTEPLSREEFQRQCMEERYRTPGSRCC
jgi:uncharacterized short protein YbdD (DUF466 family)